MPTVVATSTGGSATQAKSHQLIDRCQNGVLWSCYYGGTYTTTDYYRFSYSLDGGLSWQAGGTVGQSGNTANYGPNNAAFFIDVDDYAHLVYRDYNNGSICYKRGTPNGARTAWTWSSENVIWSGSVRNYPDVVAHREGTGWAVHIVCSFTDMVGGIATHRVEYARVIVASNQTIGTPTTSIVESQGSGNYGDTYPSIDFRHTGDGKTVQSSQPNLYIGYTLRSYSNSASNGLKYAKATYSAGSWSAWSIVVISTSYQWWDGAKHWHRSWYDGTRWVIAGYVDNAQGTTTDAESLVIFSRDEANTTTTLLHATPSGTFTTALPAADRMLYGSSTYDSLGNVYLFGRSNDGANGTRKLNIRKWTSATTTLETASLVDNRTSDTPYVAAKRGSTNDRVEFIYTDNTASPYEVKYSYVGASPESQVVTSSLGTMSAYSNQRKVDRTSNGVLWSMYCPDNTYVRFRYSTDDGGTWTDSSEILMTSNNNYVVNGSFFIDQDDYAHAVYKHSLTGEVYYRRGTPNAGRTAWTWTSATLIWAGTAMNYPDVVAYRDPGSSGWHVSIVGGYLSGTATYAGYARIAIASNGTLGSIQRDNLPVLLSNDGMLGGDYATSLHTYPSIDFHHTGDGKTVAGSAPHIFVAWSSGATGNGRGIRFRKATYSTGTWTWGAEREIDSTRRIPSNNGSRWLNCIFDGTRVLIGGQVDTASATNSLFLCERDVADTTTTSRIAQASTAVSDVLFFGSLTYDNLRNVYIFGRNTDETPGSYDLVYRKWTRSTLTLENEMLVDSGVGDPYVSVKRGASRSRIEYVYTDGTANPYSLVYGALVLNTPPDLPTGLTVTSPASDYTPSFSVSVNDVDPNGQVKARFEIELTDGSPIGSVDSGFVSGSGTATAEYLTPLGIGNYRVRAKAIDNDTAESDYTTWVAFTINTTPGAPTIGGTQPVPMYRFNWTFSDADAGDVQTRSEGEVRRQSDGVVVYNWDVSNDLQYHDVTASTFPTDTYEWRVRTYDSLGTVGAWSTYDTFTVASSSNVSVYWNGSWVSSPGTTVS